MLNIEILQQVIYTLALALFLVYISQVPRFSLFVSSLLFVTLVVAVNLVPLWRGSSLVELARGAIGDVSVASGGLLVLIIANQFDFSDKRTSVLAFIEKIFLIIMGLCLYLSTFGFIKTDIYSWGYSSIYMPIIVGVVSVFLVLIGRRLGLVSLLALIGYYYHTQFSNNLWDYLFDPVLWIVLVVDFISNLFPAKSSQHRYGDSYLPID